MRTRPQDIVKRLWLGDPTFPERVTHPHLQAHHLIAAQSCPPAEVGCVTGSYYLPPVLS